MASVNKAELVKEIAEKTEMKKKEAGGFVSAPVRYF